VNMYGRPIRHCIRHSREHLSTTTAVWRYGGKTVLLSSDFRQTLPVIAKGTRADEVRACLKSSYIWPRISRLHLTISIRVHLHNNPEAERFSKLLMDIGDGKFSHQTIYEVYFQKV